MRLLPDAARIASGEILFRGRDGVVTDLARLEDRALRRVRGRDIAMVFQEPMTSLNPVLSVGQQVAEVVRLHEGLSCRAAHARAVELLDLVRIPEPGRRAGTIPTNSPAACAKG